MLEYMMGTFGVILRTKTCEDVEETFRMAMVDADVREWSACTHAERKTYLKTGRVEIVFREDAYIIVKEDNERVFELDHWTLGIDQVRAFKEDALVRIIETYTKFFTPLGVTV